MIKQTSEKTASSLARILCSLFRQILYEKSSKDFPLKIKPTSNFVPLSNRPDIQENKIQFLELAIYTGIHHFKNNSKNRKDTRKLQNIKYLLFGSQQNFKNLLDQIEINYPKQALNFLPVAQETVRQFFCQQYQKKSNDLWIKAQRNKELYKNKNLIKNPQKKKQQFLKSKKFIHELFMEKNLKWDQSIERFCYKIKNFQRQQEARQSEARQSEARQSETRQPETMQSESNHQLQHTSHHHQKQITEQEELIVEIVWTLQQQFIYCNRWWEYEKPIPIFQVLVNDSDRTISHQNEENWFKELSWPLQR